ncbi:MAG: deoxyribodipyrimidine photo-lyase [Verrucomicrobiales bacterium]|nr:deoxyribodipyrimidine photo-lyase [Verrucomicrobiales bacterium]
MARYQNVIHWFRRDLRLSDNMALWNASIDSEKVLPVYISSDWNTEHHWTGPARQAFLCGCLESLSKNVDHAGGRLIFRRGDAVEELRRLIDESKAEALYLNRDPDPYGRETEQRAKELCREKGIEFHDFQDVVLHEPDEVLTGSGNPYKVYTPYSRTWFDQAKPDGVDTVRKLHTLTTVLKGEVPKVEDWGLKFEGELLREPGEKAARIRLKSAVEGVLGEYESMRNDPAADATSHLGADLRYGTLSAREVFHRAEEARAAARSESVRGSVHTFQKQLAWREFFMAILHHYPEVLETDFNEGWRGLNWDDPGDDDKFERWRTGRTGFPIVDAGMRQLLETGYMHNRVRMITAMFLTKDLHIHWRHGEAHFMQYLLDGEIANNNGGWQWSAGTGADAAPYFRIQNPWTQTDRFDKEGEYIKRWVPELEKVDSKQFTKPPEGGSKLCADYVEPIVDHKTERDETLRRFKEHKEG